MSTILPSFSKTWQLNINNVAAGGEGAPDDNAKTLFAIKDALIGFTYSPWTVVSSSNSLITDSSDLWNSHADLVWSTGNHSWIILQKPTSTSQILISLDQATTDNIIISWSPQGLFTGGTISLDPTAVDLVTLQTGNWNGGLVTYNSWVHVWHADDGYCSRVIVSNGTGDPRSCWIFDTVNTSVSNWNLPEVYFLFENATDPLEWLTSLSTIPITGNFGKAWSSTGIDVSLFTYGIDSVPSGFAGRNYITQQDMDENGNQLISTNPYALSPIGIVSETVGARGVHGMLYDIFAAHKDRPAGTTYPSSTTARKWVQIGEIVLPWTNNNEVPLITPSVMQGNIADESSNNNNGTPTSMENGDFEEDTPGGSFSILSSNFDGVGERVVIGNVPPLQFDRTDTFSVSCWFKTTLSSGSPVLISKVNNTTPSGYELLINGTNGALIFQLINTTTTNHMRIDTTSTGWNDGGWHHVVATWDGDVSGASGANIYIDGSNQSVTIVADTLSNSITNSVNLQFAARDGVNLPYTGNIDDVAFYDKELSSTEVLTIYNSGAPGDLRIIGPTANLIGYWLMGEDVVITTTTDSTENGIGLFEMSTSNTEITIYVMQGIDSGDPSQPAYHFWKVQDAPDSTGASAIGPDAPPFGGPLINIYVSSTYSIIQ